MGHNIYPSGEYSEVFSLAGYRVARQSLAPGQPALRALCSPFFYWKLLSRVLTQTFTYRIDCVALWAFKARLPTTLSSILGCGGYFRKCGGRILIAEASSAVHTD